MKRRIVSILLCIVMIATVFAVRVSTNVSATPGIINVPEDYPTIQAAIDAANDGDAIYVAPGIYNEAISLHYKNNIYLIGSGRDETIVEGSLYVHNSNYCIIEGFRLGGIGFDNEQGSCDYNIIRDNGIYGQIFLGNYDNFNVISCNEIAYAGYCGIYLNFGSYNIIENNYIHDCGWYGIHFNWQLWTTVKNNIIENCGKGIGVDAYARYNCIVSNTILDSTKFGIELDGSTGLYSRYMFVYNNLIYDSYLFAGIAGTHGHYIAYNNMFDNAKASYLSSPPLTELVSNYDNLVSLPMDGYIDIPNELGRCPSGHDPLNLLVDIDGDGDEDGGDTVCAIGAYGEGNPLFAAWDLQAKDHLITWEIIDGDQDETHYQQGIQIQLSLEENWESPDYDSELILMTSQEYIVIGPPLGLFKYRIRLLDQDGEWSIWRTGPDLVKPMLPSEVNIYPDTINLGGGGQYVTCYIELPKGYEVKDIDANTILLEDTLPPILDPKYGFVVDEESYIVDEDGDGILERMVKFNRSDVEEMLSPGTYNLKVTGELEDGTVFEGYSDEIKVIDPP